MNYWIRSVAVKLQSKLLKLPLQIKGRYCLMYPTNTRIHLRPETRNEIRCGGTLNLFSIRERDQKLSETWNWAGDTVSFALFKHTTMSQVVKIVLRRHASR